MKSRSTRIEESSRLAMETSRCASLLLLCDEILTVKIQLAICAANRTICVAIKKKKQLKKLLHFLLGSVSEVLRQWQT
jgi:hypothetical protein